MNYINYTDENLPEFEEHSTPRMQFKNMTNEFPSLQSGSAATNGSSRQSLTRHFMQFWSNLIVVQTAKSNYPVACGHISCHVWQNVR